MEVDSLIILFMFKEWNITRLQVEAMILTKTETAAIALGVTRETPQSLPFVFGAFGFLPSLLRELGPKKIDRSI